MANIFDKWDKEIDTEGLANDVKEAATNNTGEFKEVPHGDYEVGVQQMEAFGSKFLMVNSREV